MKVVYDNIVFSLQKIGGISVYWSELAKRLWGRCDATFYSAPNKNIVAQNLGLPCLRESFLPPFVLRYLPFRVSVAEKHIFHSSYYRVSNSPTAINVVTVHDFTYEYFRKGFRGRVHSWQKGVAIKNAAGIICVSENTKKDLVKFFPEVEKKIRVIYNGASDKYYRLICPEGELRRTFPELRPRGYLLWVGDRSPYKRFDIAVSVVNQFLEFDLVVVSNREFSDVEKKMLRDLRVRIKFFNGISEDRLNILYNNAFCLVYPSSYEGFGIPVIEAFRANCPVVAASCSSVKEIAEDCALLVNDGSAKLFAEAVAKLYDPNLRADITARARKRGEQFTWDACFEQTLKFYSDLWCEKI